MQSDTIPPNQQLVSSDKWPVVGEFAPRNSDKPWAVEITGRVEHSMTRTLVELRSIATDELETDIHCVTRWSKLGMRFGGVFLSRLLDIASPHPDARFLSFVARSERNHSTSLPIEFALENRALIATTIEGAPLEECHGGPIRVVMPGRYFYKSLKWLERIEVLVEDRLGYWEADAGYHNNANPWLEERFIASTLDKREALGLIESKDFTDRELLSLVAANHDLRGLKARGSQLRNSDFRSSNLRDADFTNANLSNARFNFADLRGACLRNADLEGANLAGADLRNADLSGASLFGASFVDCNETETGGEQTRGARLDATTVFDAERLDALTEAQQEYIDRSRRDT